jgi:hypothetical protein
VLLEAVSLGLPAVEFEKDGYGVLVPGMFGAEDTPLGPVVGTSLPGDAGPVGIEEIGVTVIEPVVASPAVSEPDVGVVMGRVETKDELGKPLKLLENPDEGTAEDGVAPEVTGPVVGIPVVMEPEVGPVTGRDEASEELEKGTEDPGIDVDDRDGAVPDVTGPVVGTASVVEPRVGPVTGRVEATDELE